MLKELKSYNGWRQQLADVAALVPSAESNNQAPAAASASTTSYLTI